MKTTASLITRPARAINHVATGAAFRKQRMARKLSIRDLGAALDLSASYICDLENGKRQWNQKLHHRFVAAIVGYGKRKGGAA